jgi:hypothetical protein
LTETVEIRFTASLLAALGCSLLPVNAGVTLASKANALKGGSDRASFDGESGAGRTFAVSGDSAGGGADDFSDFLGVSDGDLLGVLGLGFDGGAFCSSSDCGRVEAGNLDGIELSGCLMSILSLEVLKVFLGDICLGDCTCASVFVFMSGTSCRNCDRLFISSFLGDDGCDTGFSTSIIGESLAGTATFNDV